MIHLVNLNSLGFVLLYYLNSIEKLYLKFLLKSIIAYYNVTTNYDIQACLVARIERYRYRFALKEKALPSFSMKLLVRTML